MTFAANIANAKDMGQYAHSKAGINMSEEERYYGCYECASDKGEGCIIFQFGIKSIPVVCPCGYGYPKFTPITEKIKEMLTKVE